MTVVDVDPCPTIVIAETTSWEEFPRRWGPLLDEVYRTVRADEEPGGEGATERWRNVMLYKDDTPSVEVGVLATGPFTGRDRVIASQLPGGTVATAVHRGDYAGLGATHAVIVEYANAHGLQLAGPRWEIYGHWRADPAELETEIYWLIAS